MGKSRGIRRLAGRTLLQGGLPYAASCAGTHDIKQSLYDGPVFLKEFEDWIAKTGPLPDSWRGPSTPYSKAFEDPNHHWYKENFSFLTEIPRNRFEFILEVYDEYLRIKDQEPTRAAWTNVLGTGTLPYAAMENFDRMTVAMPLYRARIAQGTDESKREARYLAQDIAFYVGWLGHYTADGAQPLHNTIHVNGWKGENPKGSQSSLRPISSRSCPPRWNWMIHLHRVLEAAASAVSGLGT